MNNESKLWTWVTRTSNLAWRDSSLDKCAGPDVWWQSMTGSIPIISRVKFFSQKPLMIHVLHATPKLTRSKCSIYLKVNNFCFNYLSKQEKITSIEPYVWVLIFYWSGLIGIIRFVFWVRLFCPSAVFFSTQITVKNYT